MSNWRLKTPVAFLIFNRPHTTEKVFEAIRQAKPPKLLVIADGPRADKPGEAEKCAAVRAIIERVDWDCEVIKNYSEINLGCGKREATGMIWIFEQVEEAIVLEDDCLPHPDFFKFCEELLEKYRNDKRIMMISGTNCLKEWKSSIQSYHFSYYGGTWGWASWRRAFKYYDYEMKLWADIEVRDRIRDVLASDEQFREREIIFSQTYKNPNVYDTWDYQWNFARLVQSGLSIAPSVNLISNIGFGEGAVHTTSTDSELANLELNSLKFPLKINSFVAVDREYDRRYHRKVFKKKNLLQRVIRKLKKLYG